MHYAELPPPRALAPWVRCFWFLRTGPGAVEPIVPDGRMEIVLHRAQPFSQRHDDGRVRRQAAALVSGQLTGPIHVGPLEASDVVGIRFRTAGARDLLRSPLDELTNRIEPLVDLDSRLAENLAVAVRAEDPVHALSAALLDRLADPRSRPARHALSDAAVELLDAGHTVAHVARRLGCSERTLERRLTADVGLGPKVLQRVIRFRRYYGLLREGVGGSGAALGAGYYDQSHANRDFRSFAGASPREHFGDGPPMAAAFLSDSS